ncbi:MAG: LamG domain-containing protein [Candidatus Saccharimonadales bacterium]
MIRRYPQAGFTAVELLITLFVAAAFLIAGYQLFNIVIKDGGQARSESRAGNVAYDYLRRYSPSATDPCTAQTPLTNSPIDIDGLDTVTISVSISCPSYSTTGLSKVEATISYNTPQQTTEYATFVNGSGLQSADITDGLIGWWKFNGDANTSVGSSNGALTNATPVPGPSGTENTAYSLSGTNSYIRFDTNSMPSPMNAITISVWAKPSSASASFMTTNPVGAAGSIIQILIPYTGNTMYWDFGNQTTGRLTTPFNVAWFNTWSLYTFTASASTGTKIYRNGSVIASSATAGTYTKTGQTLDLGYYAGGSAYWTGSIDDMRMYDRALSSTEISSLYAGGAK